MSDRGKKFSAWPEGKGRTTKAAEMVIDSPISTVHAAVENALDQELRWSWVIERSESEVVVRTPPSWRTFGEVVSVSLSAHRSKTHVGIESRLWLWLRSLADYGKNKRNVELLQSHLATHFGDR